MTPEFAGNRLPEDVVQSNPEFVKFISDFYKWGTEQGYSSIINSYRQLINQEIYSKDYEDRVVSNLGLDVDIIDNSTIKTELLYKLVNEFLETRGTVTSIELLFRIMFNKNVEVRYPRETLFIASGSLYQRTKMMMISGNNQLDIGSTITGLISKSKTSIESITPLYMNNSRYYLVKCSNLFDTFKIGEPLLIETLDVSYNEVHVPLISIEIVNPGKLYKRGNIITPSKNKFTGNFIIENVSKGSIESVEIINPGIDYKVGDKILVPGNSHFYAEISKVSADGVVQKIDLWNGGYNLESIPEYQIISENGSGLTIQLISNSIGNVLSVKPSNGSIIYETGNITYSNNSVGGTGLVVKSVAVSDYTVNEYIDDVGKLGINSVVLDSFTKHSHSYDIISNVPAVKYDKIIKKYSNPSGYVYNKIYTATNTIQINESGVTGEINRE